MSFADVGITSKHEGGGDEQYSAAQHEAMCGDRKRRWRSVLVGVDDGDDDVEGSPHLWHGHSWDVPQMSEIRSIPDIYGILILHDFEAS